MKAYFLGAGCSSGTLFGHHNCPPVAAKFGCRLTEPQYPELAKVARHLDRKLSQLGLEEIWSCIDYYAKLGRNGGALQDPGWIDLAAEELKNALLSVYGHACDDAVKAVEKSACTLSRMIKCTQPGDVVISFNYDTIAEQLAAKFQRGFRHCGSTIPNGAVRFAKPHGSVSWNLHALPRDILDGEPLLNTLNSVIRGVQDPLLLGAVPIKSELIREVQFHYGACDVFHVVMNQWRAAVEAVRDAEKLVVVGYSFPKEDQYGKFLFQEGVRQRKGKPIERIEYYNLTAENETMVEIFGKETTEFVWMGKVQAAPKPNW